MKIKKEVLHIIKEKKKVLKIEKRGFTNKKIRKELLKVEKREVLHTEK